MKIVVDSNIIFSALISGKEIYLDIFKKHDVYLPDIVFPELNKYESHLIRKTKNLSVNNSDFSPTNNSCCQV